ncbi:hypothetical protein ACFV0T_26250 [Streptomyces sp. NPDC059582]|uniref:hypothetical protein n=1 Tax=Streptomyces sp. NPDC059582 TaxID=3346875 RepID=UPI0036C914E9
MANTDAGQTVQQIVDHVRTVVQARQIVEAHAAGQPNVAHRIADALSTPDLQRIQQHLAH